MHKAKKTYIPVEIQERSLLNDTERNEAWSEFTDLFLTLQMNPRMKKDESEVLLLNMENRWRNFSYADRQDIKKNIALQSPEYSRFLTGFDLKEK